jgi:hypothetical protein
MAAKKLTINEIKNLIQKVIKENEDMQMETEMELSRYMFFEDLKQIHRQTGLLLELNEEEVEEILDGGHDWAQDHIATAKESIDQVFDFMMNEIKGEGNWEDEEEDEDDLGVDLDMEDETSEDGEESEEE